MNSSEASNKPLIIAGPCSAESYEQLLSTAKEVKALGINMIRAGVWKPRTRPNSFEGIGKQALSWIKEIRDELDVDFTIEVASAQHVELALQHNITDLWIGARTTVNPFTVQEIADALQGVDANINVKNPVNPDLALWLGSIERISNANVKSVGAIHRGFSSFRKSNYRNEPVWQIPIELKRHLPDIQLICDPSHIGGDRSMIFDICQKALDMGYDGLMIETHINPDKALSDAKQQVTPQQLKEILANLQVRERSSDDIQFKTKLEELRDKIDSIDHDLIETLSSRMKMIQLIGEYKRDNNVTIFQLERWNDIIKSRPEWAKSLDLNKEYIEELYKIIHEESLRTQTEILNNNPQKTP
ncbi:3-deoxy-7-phosphoheptulonate synthase [Fulvivirga sp. RKSG066]|uniref:bifunctional 3-deoxy-7-phosphoheptulonate synthase/chorismate mutase type II n=1 Tax=Fulvivirga aurantia TaxID=2529383 RepID=UPI0012BB4B78|nr:bifunctional 3-deoxy-7-phosphoheptulonate synthase/chorismate mutase type II [Fulvivirga aurantia]MTI20399.1 3-deoxy-7-phosphoheptulonate synthase [Fulvivirga aurantia]